MEGRYGSGAIEGIRQNLGRAAAGQGLPLADLHEIARRPNTFLGHRLMAGALQEGEDEAGEPVRQELQQRLGLGLLSAYWARGEDVGDRDVLERVAEAAGMPAERVVAALDDDLSATAVRLDERRAARLGIHAVPTFMFGRRFAVSGAQPPPALADAARRALSGA
jgi:predicted DsbA family dithiol-disulfide isomerase